MVYNAIDVRTNAPERGRREDGLFNFVVHYDSRCNYVITFFIALTALLAIFTSNTDMTVLHILFAFEVLMGVLGICLSLIAIAPFSKHPKDRGFTIKVRDQRSHDVTFYQGIRQYSDIELYVQAIKTKCSGNIDTLLSEFS